MAPAELEALLAGLLLVWQVPAALSVRRDGEDLCATVEGPAGAVTVGYSVPSFGPLWRVQEAGRRPRTYPSTIGMIRHLREALAPERGAARVVFAPGAVG
ncbi:MAG: hypothetical protein KDC18_12530 [Alphaproteobacteria bacterium]|nr:hypothetical protein [Alphaproteobacteria bacterium]MCB9929127.1 hypothetical protein [Alphaproteobacteria bacterium]